MVRAAQEQEQREQEQQRQLREQQRQQREAERQQSARARVLERRLGQLDSTQLLALVGATSMPQHASALLLLALPYPCRGARTSPAPLALSSHL